MLWRTIDSLDSGKLSQRGVELRKRLENFSDQELIEFQREAASAFRSLFTPSLYYLYSAVYEGEVNGTGLTDFCSNIMLAGRRCTTPYRETQTNLPMWPICLNLMTNTVLTSVMLGGEF